MGNEPKKTPVGFSVDVRGWAKNAFRAITRKGSMHAAAPGATRRVRLTIRRADVLEEMTIDMDVGDAWMLAEQLRDAASERVV